MMSAVTRYERVVSERERRERHSDEAAADRCCRCRLFLLLC